MDSFIDARYSALNWNSPLSESHAEELLNQLDLPSAKSIVDLGCGWGELLIRATGRLPDGSTAEGVDNDSNVLHRGREAAKTRQPNVTFTELESGSWKGLADRAICIGSSHTLGGSKEMMQRLAKHVPTGRVLVGDTCWEKPPPDATRAMFDEVEPLADLVAAARDAGWYVLHLSTVDQREWDDFESRHRAGLRQWLIENPSDPRVAEVTAQQDAREKEYLTTYRGLLGFVYLILAR
jgi:trans-aconitate methyltransferase